MKGKLNVLIEIKMKSFSYKIGSQKSIRNIFIIVEILIGFIVFT